MSYMRMRVIKGIMVPFAVEPPRKAPIAEPPVAPPPPPPPVPPTPAEAATVTTARREMGVEPSPAFMKLVETIHTANASMVGDLVRRLEDPVELAKAHDLERAHPKFSGGRTGVLDDIEERLGELGVKAPNTPASDGDV